MKYLFSLLFLVALMSCYAQSPTAQVDSFSESLSLFMDGQVPSQNASFDIYISDTTHLQSIHLQIGSQDGASDLFQQTFTTTSTILLHNNGNGSAYFHIDAGDYTLNPPFVEVWLEFTGGTFSSHQKQQFVF